MPFSDSVRRELCSEAGGVCANPECQVLTGPFIPGAAKAAGDGAHIVAENILGPRGQSLLTQEERARASNGVWLCPTCHRIVDIVKPQNYSIERLQLWKNVAAQWWQRNQGLALQVAARPNVRQQVARPSPAAIQGASKFLQFHQPLVSSLDQLRWQRPMMFEHDVPIADEVENLILQKSSNRGLGLSWENEWSTTYYCDDQEFLDHMMELVKRVDCLRRPFSTLLNGKRRVQFNPPNVLAQEIINYINAWGIYQECLRKHVSWGL